ncbi:MAG: nitroreductase family protein [Planctomycetota bacterium]
MTTHERAEAVEQVIRARRTEKVCCEANAAVPVPAEVAERNDAIVLQALETAGMAPFHFPRNVDGLAEPWRARVLFDADVRKLAAHLRDDHGITNKLPKLCDGCSALVLVTWLPETREKADMTDRNEEHLAATAAMTQNLLLLLTAHGMGTYWSSGGKLRQPDLLRHIGADGSAERLAAAIFVEYPEMTQRNSDHERQPGKLRNIRKTGWIRKASL